MLKKDIEDGETYLFIGTDSAVRQHLVGRPFTVAYRKAVFRKTSGRTGKRVRFFNHDGVGARSEELEPLPPEYAGFDALDPEEQMRLMDAFRAPEPRPKVAKHPDRTVDGDQDDPF